MAEIQKDHGSRSLRRRRRTGSSSTIKQWPRNERPRERLLDEGPSSLSDGQLLAILLRTGRENATAVDLALDLLKRSEGLRGLPSLTFSELSALPGIGPAKAAQVMAAIEVGRRSMGSILRRGIKVRGSREIFDHYYPSFKALKQEVFKALLLDTKHRVLIDLTVSAGSLNQTIVHPREVFGPAIREAAAAVIVIHNHPSGDPTPSPEDIELTHRLIKAGEIIGIKIIDHLVIGDHRYVSFLDQGYLK